MKSTISQGLALSLLLLSPLSMASQIQGQFVGKYKLANSRQVNGGAEPVCPETLTLTNDAVLSGKIAELTTAEISLEPIYVYGDEAIYAERNTHAGQPRSVIFLKVTRYDRKSSWSNDWKVLEVRLNQRTEGELPLCENALYRP
jgi:hypothetical protein